MLSDGGGRKVKFQNTINGLRKLKDETQNDVMIIVATDTKLLSWLKARGRKVLFISPNLLDPRKKSD